MRDSVQEQISEEEEEEEGSLREAARPRESSAESKGGRAKWSSGEKKRLLWAMERYGSEDVNGISSHFPGVPVSSIKRLIRVYRVTADYMYEDKLIDEWLGCGLYRAGDKPVSEALRLIELFEDRPAGFPDRQNFREIYRFLGKILSDDDETTQATRIPSLSPADLRLILGLLKKLENRSWPNFQGKLFDYLSKMYKRRNIRWDYQGKKGREELLKRRV